MQRDRVSPGWNLTPGPWSIERTSDHNADFRVMDEQEVTIALFYQQPYDTWNALDNATLCRKAPELLEALRMLAEEVGRVREDFKEFGGMEDPDLEKAYHRAFDVIMEATTLEKGELG